MENKNDVENVIIIGGGPAGLAAAVYNARANLNPLVFAGSPPGGQLTLTTEVENYPGIESIMGPDLITQMRKHAQKFGTRILDENVVKVDFTKKPFVVETARRAVSTKTIIIATGAKALWLGLESETRLRGKGVSACATCDGFFFRNLEIAVIGGGDSALEEANFLTRFASKVTLIHRRDKFRASKIMQERALKNPKIQVVWDTGVEEVLGDKEVERLKLKNLKTGALSELKVAGAFVAIGHSPNTKIFDGQLDMDETGYLITKNGTRTNKEGVFAAGDVQDHVYRQAITAAGTGCMAAIDAEKFLESLHA
jgi:thioredoxin reductase (NADPH)